MAQLSDSAEQRRKSRRIDHNTGAKHVTPKDEQPPHVRPKWNILERQSDAGKIAELQRKINELEKSNMEQERSLTLTQYGDKRELAVVKERVALAPYAANLNDAGRAMVAQICFLLDWNPFFDLHPFINKKGKLCLVPDYKKMISMAKEHQRLNDSSRVMTETERHEHGLAETQIGYVTEIKEVDTFLEFARAGVADQYVPVVGYGIVSKGESVPKTWTPAMLSRKRSQRHAFGQLTPYKIVSKRFQDALMQIGALSVTDTGDGFEVEAPDTVGASDDVPLLVSANHFWGDKAQRQAFWIAAKALGKNKSAIAAALDISNQVTDDSATWAPFMKQFPDLENAIAYVDVVAENLKQQSDEESTAPEVVQGGTPPVVINGETGEVLSAEKPADTADHWWLDDGQRKQFWDNNSSAGRNAAKVAELFNINTKYVDNHDAQEWLDTMRQYENTGLAMVALMQAEQANES